MQVKNSQVWKLRKKKLDRNKKSFNRILYDQSLFYIFEIIRTKLISQYYNSSLASHFDIKKIRKLVIRKYHKKTLYYNIKFYYISHNI